jgi:hypothetical protein
MKKIQAYTVLVIICIWWACKKNTSQEPNNNTTDSTVVVIPKPDAPGKVDTLPSAQIPVQPKATIKGKIAPLEIIKVAKVILYGESFPAERSIGVGDDGNFIIDNIPAGRYRLAINTGPVRGDATIRDINLSAGQVKDFQTIMVGAGNNGYTLYGNSTITGLIQPAAAAYSVSAYSQVLQSQYTGTIDAGGNFIIKDLPEGQFDVGVFAAQYFTVAVAGPKQVVLTRGQTVDVGAFSLYSDKNPNSPNYLTYELDGVKKYKETANGANYLAPDFSLSTYKTAVVTIISLDTRSSVVADKLDIILDELNGPGTYVTRGTVKSQIKLTHRDIKFAGIHGYTAGPVAVWSSTGKGGSATVTITAIDTVNHTISGTFTATTVPESGIATGNKVITNGVFSNFSYSPKAP